MFTKHGPLPPRPASATNRAPFGPKASPRGLLRPLMTISASDRLSTAWGRRGHGAGPDTSPAGSAHAARASPAATASVVANFRERMNGSPRDLMRNLFEGMQGHPSTDRTAPNESLAVICPTIT